MRTPKRMLVLVVAAAAAAPLSPSATAQAKAMVRIERPARASEEEWKRTISRLNRRERIVTNERGEQQLQRLFEYE